MSEIAWLLERVHRLKTASRAAKQRAADAAAVTESLWRQLDDAQAHLAQAETGSTGETRPDVKARVEKRRAELTEQISTLEPQVEAAKLSSTACTEFEIATSAVFERCQQWLDTNAHGDVAFEKVDIAVQGDPHVSLQKLEAELARLASESERIEHAPTARADIEHAVRQHLDKLRAEPEIFFENGRVEIVLPGMQRQPQQAYFPVRSVRQQDLLALALWLDADKVEQGLQEVLDRIPASKDALTADMKRQKLHEIASKREACLYEAGAVVRLAVEQGTPVPISKLLTAEHLLGVRVRPALAVVA